MPIGASKVGALGGLVPGGSVTFNASGTWDVPPGVKIVSITGVGGAGNPGNPGTPGSAGNAGGGGGGGAGGLSENPGTTQPQVSNNAQKQQTRTGGGGGSSPGGGNGGSTPGAPPNNSPGSVAGNSGNSGSAGNAGTAGSAGNPGNTGQSSSGLGNTFNGGAGGNAGSAGAAGNGGTGGTGGGGGGANCGPVPSNRIASVGSGGNGGGAGLNVNSLLIARTECFNFPIPAAPIPTTYVAETSYVGTFGGGGGAGETNSGGNATVSVPNSVTKVSLGFPFAPPFTRPTPANNPQQPIPWCAGHRGPATPPSFCPASCFRGSLYLASARGAAGNPGGGAGGYGVISSNRLFNPGLPSQQSQQYSDGFISLSKTGGAATNSRAGGGGGAGGWTRSLNSPSDAAQSGAGGGGGGGRGNLGNSGGAGNAGGAGAAATPATFNCVPVTPGAPTPITVGSPGGQIVISWNPQ